MQARSIHVYFYIYIYKAGYLGARVRVHDGAHMRTLVADARVAMCRRINRTFAFPPSTVVPFYALPHCLASHAAYRKHSLTCSVFFPFFSFFFFLLPPFRSSNPASLRGRILRVRRIYVATFGRDPKRTFYYADDASGNRARWMEKRIVIVSRSPSFPNF